MDISVLGPFKAEAGGCPIVSNAAKPRQVLALLAIRRNQVLPVGAIMEELWGDDLARRTITTLQTYIFQLRRSLTAALANSGLSGKDVLVTRHGGYLLRIEPDCVDVDRYECLVAAGKAAGSSGDDEAASRLLGQALSVWRGPSLVDVNVGRLLRIEVSRLEESRIEALERRIDADLRLGRHSDLLTELTMLTAQHPLHEGFYLQHMFALYRCGRRGDALATYSRLRDQLVDELGLEPSSAVQRLHQRILIGDADLESGGRAAWLAV